jgi:hypothetical protein
MYTVSFDTVWLDLFHLQVWMGLQWCKVIVWPASRTALPKVLDQFVILMPVIDDASTILDTTPYQASPL